MRRIFGVLLTVTVVMGFAFGARAQNESNALVLDVYSVKVASDVVQEKAFALWARALKQRGKGSHERQLPTTKSRGLVEIRAEG
jgi:hypothetical protein